MVLVVLTIMIVERYVNRCDTKAVDNKSLIDDAGSKSFFNKKEKGLQRLNTRSMTMKLKTMNTVDIDVQGTGA